MRVWGLILVFMLPVIIGGAFSGYFGLERGTPSVESLLLLHDRFHSGTEIYADDGSLVARLSAQRGVYRSISEMPLSLISAVVSIEDSRFFQHGGVDIWAILRAFASNLYYRDIRQGGSTITQQLVKVTLLSPDRTFRRKFREAYLALKIESGLSKEKILELYLNEVYFGHGAYGVEMASNVYFGKSVSDLTLPETALLAGLIRAPQIYSPFLNERMAKKRQAKVLRRMAEEGYITSGQAEAALNEPISLNSRKTLTDENQYFVDQVMRHLESTYSHDQIYRTGLMVYTTLSPEIQHKAQEALKKGILALDKRRGWRGPIRHGTIKKETPPNEETFQVELVQGTVTEAAVYDVGAGEAVLTVRGRTGILLREHASWARKIFEPATGKVRYLRDLSLDKILKAGDVILVRVLSITRDTVSVALEQEPDVEGALVSVEPSTGYIRALVGGYDYGKSQFNRGVYARRQPGSAFKPVIYSAALEMGYTPATIINDTAFSYINEYGEEWNPRNYDEEYHGLTTLREALAYSRNIVSIRLLEEIGINTAIEHARALGIKSDFPQDLTLALGSLSVTPFDLTLAYTPFANGGYMVRPILIKKVYGPHGEVLETNMPSTRQVLRPETAYLMTTMLQDAVAHGTAGRARALERKDLAAKTGTTNEYRDAWFIGYTPGLLAGVWVGHDDMSPLGKNETGSRAAGPIWLDFMRECLPDYQGERFEPPEGIISLLLDSETGLVVNSPADEFTDDLDSLPATYYVEHFREGTEPPIDPETEIILEAEPVLDNGPEYRIFN